MGCTSSAPNSVSANANKEDKSIQFEDTAETQPRHDVIDTESETRTETKVLPPSDTIVETAEPVRLVRKNKSTTSLEPEKDLHNGHIIENEETDASEEMKEEKEDRIAKLEEVVGKFIEITQQETNQDKQTDSSTDETPDSAIDNEETGPKMETESNDDENKNSSEEAEEASPSLSQSSRATRWEALADIAAELPPSLAVDPLTGQIYSLSK